MAESSACLMRSFSQPSSASRDSQEGDPLRNALTTSISFGRFMSESLAWEKWSSFTQNRYLEDVEKYARPGSVAEKKAYFEAHYKRKAAQKAAASLELQNVAVNDIPASVLKTLTDSNSLIETGKEEGCYVAMEEGLDEENLTSDINLSVDKCGTDEGAQSPLKDCNVESDRLERLEQGIEQPTSADKLVESSTLPEYGQSPPQRCSTESHQIEVSDGGMEKPAFVENKVELSILPQYGQSPQRKCRIGNEEIDGTEQERKHPTPKQKQVESSTILDDAQCIIDEQQVVKTPAQDTASMGVSAFSSKKKPPSASTKSSGYRQGSRLRPNPKPTTPIQPKSGDQATSYCKRTGMGSLEKKRSTPKSLHTSINFGSHVGDTNKLSSPEELQKIENPKLVRNCSRTTGESTKQKTLTRASTSGVSNLSATRHPAIGRTRKVPIHSISESVTVDRKSESLYVRPKAQHPFNLRTEERAAKRREKLQERHSMEAAEKEHLQARVKGKVQNDAKDVLQSIASQGKANTSFHLGIKPLDVEMQKAIRKQVCSPVIERKQDSGVLQNHSRPTWRHSVKADSFNDLGKNHLPPTGKTKLFRWKKCMNENTSPNIQF